MVFICPIGCVSVQIEQRHDPSNIPELSVNNFLCCIMSKIRGTEQPSWPLWQSLNHNWISLNLLLCWQHLKSCWRCLIVSAENRNAARNFMGRKQSYYISIQETRVSHMPIGSNTGCHTQCITDSEIVACYTHKLLPLIITSLLNDDTGFGFWWTYCNGSFVICTPCAQIEIIDYLSSWRVIGIPISRHFGICLISLTELWDMTICLCMCKGHTGHTRVQDSTVGWLMCDQRDIFLLPTDNRGHAMSISANIH